MLHGVGFLIGYAAGLRRRIWLCAALGFFVGLATYVLLSLLVLGFGIPYRLQTMASALIAVVIASLVVIARVGRPTSRDLKIGAGFTFVFAAISLPLTHWNLSLLARDSHMFVGLGRMIGDDAGLADGVLTLLCDWGVFVPVAQSAAAFLPQEYLYGLSLQLAMSFAALFPLLLRAGLDALAPEPPTRGQWRKNALWIAVITAAMFSIFHYQHHFVHIHNNFGTSVYLFIFVSLFWLAEVKGEPELLPIAFLAAVAASFHRVENPIVTLLFVVVVVFPSRLPRRALAVGLVSLIIPVIAWHALLATEAPTENQFLNATRCYLLIAVLVAVLIGWLATQHQRLGSLAQRAPEIALALCSLALLLAFALKPAHMGESTSNWVFNLVSGYWGVAWPLIGLLIVLASFLPRPANGKIIVYGVAAQILLIVFLGFGRSPYIANHVGSSANRMMMHFFPLLFFYLGLKLLAPFGAGDRTPHCLGENEERT